MLISQVFKSKDRRVAQLVEHRSPKPRVAGSIPVSPAKVRFMIFNSIRLFNKVAGFSCTCDVRS